MHWRTLPKRLGMWITLELIVAAMVPYLSAQTADPPVRFSQFTVPGSTGRLGVSDINDLGEVVGYYTDTAGDIFGFVRTSRGGLTTLSNPSNTGSPAFTAAYGVNNFGAIAGLYVNTAANAYESFLYTNGNWGSYFYPGLPAGSETGLYKANDVGGYCGFVIKNVSPYPAQAFVSTRNGAGNAIFSGNDSVNTFCEDINDFGTAVGSYQDSKGVWHGFVRTAGGAFKKIDYPGASTVQGNEPCPDEDGPNVGNLAAGTVVLGINNLGDISGHFWDTSYNEHGFVLSGGKFTQIDYPGAYQTGGGGLNDLGQFVGHYVDSSCTAYGYIANLW